MSRQGWKHKLRLGDVFHNDGMSFEEIRDEVVRRIRAARFWDEGDFDLADTVDLISDARDVGEFDLYWDQFYNWADDNRVWVETRAA